MIFRLTGVTVLKEVAVAVMPLAMIWRRAPGASILDLRGIQLHCHY